MVSPGPSSASNSSRRLGSRTWLSMSTLSSARPPMAFMSAALFDCRPFPLLTIVDCCSREGLATVPRATFRAFNVVEVLDRLVAERGKPKTIRVDNGPEFAGRMLDQWAYLNGVELD